MAQKCENCNGRRFRYTKVVKNKVDFIDNVTRRCLRCGMIEFFRPLREEECSKVGSFPI